MIRAIFRRGMSNWLWINLLPVCLFAAIDPSYVTCEIKGQLGNQLFQIAATLGYAWDNRSHPIFPELNNDELDILYNRDHLFFRLDNSLLPRPLQSIYKHPYYFSIDKIPFHPDQYLSGFFFHGNIFIITERKF